jgi:hypothetical protein
LPIQEASWPDLSGHPHLGLKKEAALHFGAPNLNVLIWLDFLRALKVFWDCSYLGSAPLIPVLRVIRIRKEA